MDTLVAPPQPLTIQLSDAIAMTFQPIPAGRFRRGSRGYRPSEEPVRLITIPDSFYLATFPVTQEQFTVWTSAAGIEHKNKFPDRHRNPAENMNWFEAMSFCAWINETCAARLPAGYFATLPDETRWEYACRAEHPQDGSQVGTEYHGGNGVVALEKAGWFNQNSDRQTQPVGQKEANARGLHDMHGNVWEWCSDAWDENAYRRSSGVAPVLTPEFRTDDDRYRVVRGGSWGSSARVCRSARRYGDHPAHRFRYQGFRVCLVPGLTAEPGTEQMNF